MRSNFDHSAWPEALEAQGLTLAEFTDLVMEVFELIFPGVKVRKLSGSTYNLVLSEKGSVTFDLANVWAICRDQPGHRREVLGAFATAMIAAVDAAFDPDAIDPALLIPVLRAGKERLNEREKIGDGGALESIDAAEESLRMRVDGLGFDEFEDLPTAEPQEEVPAEDVEAQSARNAGESSGKGKADGSGSQATLPESVVQAASQALKPIRPFAGDLSIYIAQDGPESLQYLFPDDIESLDMPEPELFELAQSNLVRILNGHGVTIEPREGGIYNVVAGGDLESSLLLRGPFWKTIKEKLKLPGRIVAAAPIRGSLMFVDGDNAEHVQELRQIVQTVYENGPHPLSSKLFGRYGDGWIAE